jgi:small subunit ribosomal protein S16
VSVRIRLSRAGRRHLPFYHIAVFDKRERRETDWVDLLGTYDPTVKDEAGGVELDLEKAREWIAKGAQPSETVAGLLRKAGLELPDWSRKKKTRKARPRTGERQVKERSKPRTAKSAGVGRGRHHKRIDKRQEAEAEAAAKAAEEAAKQSEEAAPAAEEQGGE